MTAKVILLPRDLNPADVQGRTVVVFDVLRATTTMTAALAAGVEQIHVFDNLASARNAASAFVGPKVLCGEVNCLPPPGFDLGNCPIDWRRGAGGQSNPYAGRRVFMSTTNGTRAVAAAAPHRPVVLLVGALVNATAVAQVAVSAGQDVTLLCAGTAGEISLEDILGAGAVLDSLIAAGATAQGDPAQLAWQLFIRSRDDLGAVLSYGAGGRNLFRAGLEADIEFCSRLNSYQVVGTVDPQSLIIRPFMQ